MCRDLENRGRSDKAITPRLPTERDQNSNKAAGRMRNGTQSASWKFSDFPEHANLRDGNGSILSFVGCTLTAHVAWYILGRLIVGVRWIFRARLPYFHKLRGGWLVGWRNLCKKEKEKSHQAWAISRRLAATTTTTTTNKGKPLRWELDSAATVTCISRLFIIYFWVPWKRHAFLNCQSSKELEPNVYLKAEILEKSQIFGYREY